MVTPSNLKTLHSQVFSAKSPSSTLTSMKIKTLIHTLIISHVCRMVRALSKAKTMLLQILKESQPINLICATKETKRKHRQRKVFFGSFRLHYNWCSSHVLPVQEPAFYYDSTWNSLITMSDQENQESQLSGYLHWLENQKVQEKSCNGDDDGDHVNEIDRLADMFIANCHEKFRLEKQESYRRFQEMMTRSM
ncbi:uncharacterized protein LOC110621803 [Manihot esculenta]|uniref:DUF761 domain-containing protein n=1 Tax=Manihot esculenta TaxID=3983 RepID=A0A2C9VFB7_MANES|nr:uncharacterized protein LOC110621803 [Manihot esculenta]OAY43140.1 hypothetical protein MANES_08G045500v8 [Manihot esculenta]